MLMQEPGRSEETLDVLELKLLMVVSRNVTAGTQSRSSSGEPRAILC